MRGQTSLESILLVSAIILIGGAAVYTGQVSNEAVVVSYVARDGAENAIVAVDMEYGTSTDIERLEYFDNGTIIISLVVRGTPPVDIEWENFRENILENKIREVALKHAWNAIGGTFSYTTDPLQTNLHTYDVVVSTRRVTR